LIFIPKIEFLGKKAHKYLFLMISTNFKFLGVEKICGLLKIDVGGQFMSSTHLKLSSSALG